ncbi:MAG: non-hydrolyzing UDP-N-acetylglucosamine 2-epimerase [Thermodesulfobacteriota bacterium]
MDKRILHVVGARPNFMKAAPVHAALAEKEGVSQLLAHTGQHYDEVMSGIFFKELELPEPDLNLGVGSASHASQTAEVMIRFEKVVLEHTPDLVVVYGDVNSTLAAALVCAKLGVSVAHVEAGLRSFDTTMPEEVNRVLTDHISDLLFTPSVDGNENLAREGVDRSKVHLVGNVMIDTLMRLFPKALECWYQGLSEQWGQGDYALVTLHRPSNVDDPKRLGLLMEALDELCRDVRVVFPIHPRTRSRLKNLSFDPGGKDLHLIEPLGYLDFLALQRHASVVITDSGGIQAESTFMGVPCVTARSNTEWPVTTDMGTNTLVGFDTDALKKAVREALKGLPRPGAVPPLWDGHAGQRIASTLFRGHVLTAP